VDGAPRWKGTTGVTGKAADPALTFGCTMTWPAVMVVPFVVPRTRTGWPLLTALAELFLVPFLYVVEETFLTVTFSPADVVSVKLDFDTLPTVPIDPPAAGPDRALDPPPPRTGCPEVVEEGEVVDAVAEPLPAVAPTMP
jgi:hypothetical protein